eukprot:4474657-Amphidinium_carterae.1
MGNLTLRSLLKFSALCLGRSCRHGSSAHVSRQGVSNSMQTNKSLTVDFCLRMWGKTTSRSTVA